MEYNQHNNEYLRSISQIFTCSSLRKIIDCDSYDVIDKRLSLLEKDLSRKEQIQALYQNLFSGYKVEYLYKNTLLNKILLGKYSTNTSTAFDEFKIGFSVADFVLLNGEAKIFEIKTELDTLEKLEKQINDYKKFGDKVYVVSHAKHIPVLKEKFSKTSVGVIEWTKRNTLKTLSLAKSNSKHFDHETIFKTLRKPEYLKVTKKLLGEIPDVPNTLIYHKCLELLKTIPVQQFQAEVVKLLKQRKLNCPNLLTSQQTPYELRYLCHTMDLREKQYEKLFKFLNQP